MNGYVKKAAAYLNELCVNIGERPVGSAGNIEATNFFRYEMDKAGWETQVSELKAMDWHTDGAFLQIGKDEYEVYSSPYSNGCNVFAGIVPVSTVEELEASLSQTGIFLLYGDIAKEQLMPKNFVFYNPPEHRKIISLLEKSKASALLCATGRNAALAGGSYPFPLIEDGDFDIPSVYMTEETGQKILAAKGKKAILKSAAERIPSKAFNVVARKGNIKQGRIVVTAHIDAKKGTPGAIDNATGVIVLLLLADLLKDYSHGPAVEIVAFNGEDYYAVPGQMKYIEENNNNFDTVLLNINIDGAGYIKGKSAISFYDVPKPVKEKIDSILNNYNGITEGVQWPQGDHSIFVQYGRPAVAISSQWFTENITDQDITHTDKDIPGIVDPEKLVDISRFLAETINAILLNR